jgi:hypothetical protein
LQNLAYPIRSSFDIKDVSCSLAAHADLCRAPRGLILWAGPPLTARTMYNPMDIGGYTPQLVPERLVYAKQRYLELV